MKASQSKVKLFRKCKRAYHNRYVLKLKSKKVAPPLSFGKIVHHMLECDAEGIAPDLEAYSEKELQGIGPNERTIYKEILDKAKGIMVDYGKFWESQPLKHLEINESRAEHKIEYKINDDITFVGIVDGIVTDIRGRNWLLEHKTGAREMSDNDKWLSLQNAVYYEVMERLDFPPIEGVQWNFILSKEPTKPKILNSGKVSTAKMITLPSTVEKFILENPEITDIEKNRLEETAKEGAKRYFNRSTTLKNECVKKTLFDGYVETAEEIVRDHGKVKAMTIDQHCSYCEFKDLCRAELENADVDYVRERDFITNE
jgi:ATP-dependent helicase/DNAse subunit B